MREDHAQLTALYDAHAAPVWRYVVSLTGDHAGADDVVQETLLRAWRTPRVMAAPMSVASPGRLWALARSASSPWRRCVAMVGAATSSARVNAASIAKVLISVLVATSPRSIA